MNGDFSHGSLPRHILRQAIPLTLAQLVQVLYSIIDRIYLGHLEELGDLALTGIGITAPVIGLVTAFTLLFGQGGAPLCAIAEGAKEHERAERIMGTTLSLLLITAGVVMAVGYLFETPILTAFGATEGTLSFARQYYGIYLLGTFFVMFSVGMNGFINLQGFPRIGMMTTVLGAVANLILDPVFIYLLHWGITGAAVATVIAQGLSAAWVLRFFLSDKSQLRIRPKHLRPDPQLSWKITGLGLTGFMMAATNSLVQIACNRMLGIFGGDLYISVMTVLNAVRDLFTLPVNGLTSGAQPVISYNYGAREPKRVCEGIRFMALLGFGYSLVSWLLIVLLPHLFVSLFTPDAELIAKGTEAIRVYFFAFVFMSLQFSGQSTFVSLGRAKYAVFFSIFRKVLLVVPLTILLPQLGLGVTGVFLAEPISNVVGGLACFTTMLLRVYLPLSREGAGEDTATTAP